MKSAESTTQQKGKDYLHNDNVGWISGHSKHGSVVSFQKSDFRSLKRFSQSFDFDRSPKLTSTAYHAQTIGHVQ